MTDPTCPRPRIAVLGTDHVHLSDYLAVMGRDSRAIPVVAGAEEDPRAALQGADAAVICSTTAQHAPLLGLVVDAGLPALVEKPLAATARETADLLTLAGRSPAPVTTAMFLRCAPALRRVRELVLDGELGQLVGADLGFSHPGLLDGLFEGCAAWMTDPDRGGSGGFADLGIHLLDLLRWLRPDAALQAHGAAVRAHPGLAVDAGGTAVLDWGGIPAALCTSWTSRPGGLRLQMEGTAGTVDVRDGELRIAIGTHRRTERYAPPSAGEALVAFLAQLRGEASWEAPTAEDISACTEALEALHM